MENSYSIEQLIEQLEDLMSEATRVPFNKKCLIDIERMNDVVQEMRMVMPMEIQQAQKVVMDKNNIINSAKQEAENIIRKAEQLRAEMLNENDLVKEARRRATELLSSEQSHCADLRASTNDYIDKMLKRVIDLMANDLNELNTLRAGINGAAQPQREKIHPLEKPGE